MLPVPWSCAGIPDAIVAVYKASKKAGEVPWEQVWQREQVHGKETPMTRASGQASTASGTASAIVALSYKKDARVFDFKVWGLRGCLSSIPPVGSVGASQLLQDVCTAYRIVPCVF